MEDTINKPDQQPSGDFVPRDIYERDKFYANHKEYARSEIARIIEATAKSEGKSREEIIADESFLKVYKGVTGYEESEKARSVLSPKGPQLGQVADKFDEARADIKAGNQSEATHKAAQAVIDAYDLRG